MYLNNFKYFQIDHPHLFNSGIFFLIIECFNFTYGHRENIHLSFVTISSLVDILLKNITLNLIKL